MGGLLLPLYYHETIVWPPSSRPVSTDLVDELLDNVEVDGCFIAPSVLEDLSQIETSLEKLKRTKMVLFGGGQSLASFVVAMLTDDQVLLQNVPVIRFPNTPKSSMSSALRK